MLKLLSADLSRLRKDKVFWGCMAAMLFYSVAYMLNGCRQAKLLEPYHRSIDDYYFHFGLAIGMFGAIFSSLFFGTEYSDGTIRNKIVVGHTRKDIYLSNLATAFLAMFFILLAWLAGAMSALPFLGAWEMGIPGLLLYLLVAVASMASFSAIFVCLAMLSDNKARTVVCTILLVLGMTVFSSMLYNALGQPEMTSGITITKDGMQTGVPMQNPDYVSGIKREIYDFLLDFLPAGQGIRMWQREIAHPVLMLASSVLITAGVTLGGIFAFRRKNLR